jgi:hypothetical protein
MSKLKLGPIETDKPVRISIRLPAPVHRDLLTYAETLAKESQQPAVEPAKLIPAMIEHFMATDRGFARLRNSSSKKGT